MTTQEMIDWLQMPPWIRPHRFDLTSDEASEAIAARLKALEEMRERVRILAEAGLAWQLQERPAADELGAILDTVREVEK